jgi:hypothetical protein
MVKQYRVVYVFVLDTYLDLSMRSRCNWPLALCSFHCQFCLGMQAKS